MLALPLIILPSGCLPFVQPPLIFVLLRRTHLDCLPLNRAGFRVSLILRHSSFDRRSTKWHVRHHGVPLWRLDALLLPVTFPLVVLVKRLISLAHSLCSINQLSSSSPRLFPIKPVPRLIWPAGTILSVIAAISCCQFSYGSGRSHQIPPQLYRRYWVDR